MTTIPHSPLSLAYGIDDATAVANIVACFRLADADQRERGAHWYDAAHALALTLDPNDVRRAAGVIAALSPQMPWPRNVRLAVTAFRDGAASGAPFALQATRILQGEDIGDVFHGPKVRAFAATIADPSGTADVVIDRHALSVMLSRCSDDKDASRLDRKGVYGACVAAYVAAGRTLGVSATVVQATTWVVWRESAIRTSAAARRERSGEKVSA